ncbi:Na+/H+ antiporter [Paenibacillus solani]|uniref:Sodium:proton antiporter n=1 Tax=Paenibacillus solani TaxID=1705565 RepID=A0A0M1P5A4_9BACL|nr:Na+/H+ antiporter [Paenibacillus solani]KOR89663.1 sodium:proton antiporter [Paenibacillus solani]
MELFIMVLVFLVLIGISNIIHRFIPFIPVPLIQIALGIGAAYVRGFHHVELNPELFLVLFIAPLLFNDGKLTPRDELWKLRSYILLLALGLVFATVLIAGPFIHWLIPAIPLSAAFALAAILSPTDAVAVGSLSGRVKLPGKIMRLLEGEALMNDASGLVAFNFAIAATVTGYFSLTKAIGSFVVIAVGGIVIGALLGFLVIWFRMLLRRFGMEDVTLHMLIIILTPFIIYLVAEEFHVSGILAVVAAGVTHAVERDRMRSASIKLRVVSDSTWSIILFTLNGLVFILLGHEIPDVVNEIWSDPAYNNGQVIGYVLLITAVLILLRFVWVWASTNRQFKSSLLTALSGVRGALTLAAAFSIPLTLSDNSPFPERNLMLFICAGVILLTLMIASILLPILTRESHDDVINAKHDERIARVQMLKAGLCAIREEMSDENKDEAMQLIYTYSKRIQQAQIMNKSDMREFWSSTIAVRQIGLDAERHVAETWLKERKGSPRMVEGFLVSLNKVEMLLTSRYKFKLLIRSLWRQLKRLTNKSPEINEMPMSPDHPQWEEYKVLKQEAIQAAIHKIQAMERGEKPAILQAVIADYRAMEHELLNDRVWSRRKREFTSESMELELKAIQAERNQIQSMFEEGEIDRAQASHLRMDINYREAHLYESQA